MGPASAGGMGKPGMGGMGQPMHHHPSSGHHQDGPHGGDEVGMFHHM
jgi:hypothetical protein